LNVTAIHILPLRDRRADIAPLVEHFLSVHQRLGGPSPVAAAPDFVSALESAHLPGNARQVENLVRQAMVLRKNQDTITLADLPPDLLRELAGQKPVARAAAAGGVGGGFAEGLAAVLDSNNWSLSRSLEQLEDLIVETALRHANGNQAQAARRLGITPRSVYNKLHRRA
jgi:DNA-binding NtrC family response regulator